ncbi:hypothetical protein ES705_12608 [subsurface metagenome]
MENEINIRLRLILDKEELTSSQFANIVGYRPSSISHILSGRNKPGFDFIREILKKFDTINPEWLILGRGEMYKTTDNVIDDNVGSEPNQVPYVSNVKDKIQGEKIKRVLVFYNDQTFTEYLPADDK